MSHSQAMTPFLTIPAIVSRVATLADGTCRVSLDANELPESTMGRVMGVASRKEFGTMVWVPDGEAQPEGDPALVESPEPVDTSIPVWREPTKGKGALRNSQRIRIAARERWDAIGKQSVPDFEDYYTQLTDLLIGLINDYNYKFRKP